MERLLRLDALFCSSEGKPRVTIAKMQEMSMPWNVIFFFPAKRLTHSHLGVVLPCTREDDR